VLTEKKSISMRMGIAFKINMILLAVILCLGCVVGTLFVVTQQRLLSEDLDRRIQLFGGYLCENLEYAVSSGNLAAVDQQLMVAPLDEEIAYVMVKSKDGEILAARWINQTAGNISEYSFPLHDEKRPNEHMATVPFGLSHANATNAATAGQLAIGADLTILDAKEKKLYWGTAAIVTSTMIFALFVGLLFVRLLLQKSLVPIFEGIHRIGEGELDYRFDASNNDEIGEVGKKFNEMAGRLSETLVSKRKLESTVEERTSALNSALEERLRLTAQLTQAQKMESIGRLAGGVAHDFNNILCIIIGHAEMSMLNLPRNNPLWESFNEIVKAAQRSSQITRQLLAFSRKQVIEPKAVNLNGLILDSQKNLGRLIGEDVKLIVNPGESLWDVLIDPSQVDQIMMNLLVNARDSMSGGGSVSIATSNICVDEEFSLHHLDAKSGDYVKLTVADTGCGMDGETREHIFEPFFTTKEAGKGTGLGLSTVYGIVTQNRGFINCYSEPGKGTVFTIYLPRQVDGGAIEEKSVQGPSFAGTGTVLLVEDDETLLKSTGSMLKKMGYKLIQASSPQKAISQSEEACPVDLIITDVVMPGMNGKEMVEKIKSVRPGVKILFMSGYPADIITNHGVIEGGTHFISKPFNMEQLNKKIEQVLAT